MICGSQAEATVGHNDDDRALEVMCDVNTNNNILAPSPPPPRHAIITGSRDVPPQDVATIRNMTSISSNVTRQIKSNPGLGSSTTQQASFLSFRSIWI